MLDYIQYRLLSPKNMTDYPKNSPEQISYEKPKENEAIGNFAKSLKSVSVKYSESLRQKYDPKKTKEIALRQIKELQATIEAYKKDCPSNNPDLKKIEDNIGSAQIFLDE